MDRARYEVTVDGCLSDRARSAFGSLGVAAVPAQTVVFGEVTEHAGLRDLLALCRDMSLEVVSLRRLPDEDPAPPAAVRCPYRPPA